MKGTLRHLKMLLRQWGDYSKENEAALDAAYEDGLQAGREEIELELLDQIDEARKEGYDEGYAEALENAIKAMGGLQ
uniref:Uncharacterized protein n=1 Tax=Podoviridae sp. ctU557 TaxID=2827736 RepID=A0A8S5T8F5_9CAUD|nr:MAG TPA: hypothetical protein [Podoviridae sp. ctU557]